MPLVTKPLHIDPSTQEHADAVLLVYLTVVSFNGAKPIGASRIAGLVTRGNGHGRAIQSEAGTMSGFSVALEGIALECAPTTWRGKPK
jgi:hypothetical protein